MYDILEKIELFLVEPSERLDEIKYKKVIRKGKIKRKAICPPGFKVVKGKCVKQHAAERLKRARSTKKAQRRIQASGIKTKLLRARAKSMRKRKAAIPMQKPFSNPGAGMSKKR
jgi:hypothetical protein